MFKYIIIAAVVAWPLAIVMSILFMCRKAQVERRFQESWAQARREAKERGEL